MGLRVNHIISTFVNNMGLKLKLVDVKLDPSPLDYDGLGSSFTSGIQ